MGIMTQVQICRVVLGVYGDNDSEPRILMGTCEGIAHVGDLMVTMKAAMDQRLGLRPRMDYFWDGSSVWTDVEAGS